MSIHQTEGAGGLPKLVLRHASGSTADVYLHGAHVASWRPAAADEVLFLSPTSAFADGQAIRGGIPVIFPQFAATGPFPRHGFARTRAWTWDADASTDTVQGASAVLRLQDSPETRAAWPYPFRATLTVLVEAESLTVRLGVENTGQERFTFTAALHTYLRVADVREAAVEGLQGVRYRSALEGPGDLTEEAAALVPGGTVDRLYLEAPAELRVRDGRAGRVVCLRSAGFRDAVVWNPGREGAAGLPDLEAEAYLQMLCVEAAQVGVPVALAPGAAWEGAQHLYLMPMPSARVDGASAA